MWTKSPFRYPLRVTCNEQLKKCNQFLTNHLYGFRAQFPSQCFNSIAVRKREKDFPVVDTDETNRMKSINRNIWLHNNIQFATGNGSVNFQYYVAVFGRKATKKKNELFIHIEFETFYFYYTFFIWSKNIKRIVLLIDCQWPKIQQQQQQQ